MGTHTAGAPLSDEGLHLATSEVLFTRILVGTDLSRQSEEALRLAANIGHLFGARLFVVHAVSPLIYGTGADMVPAVMLDAGLDSSKTQVEDLLKVDPSVDSLHPMVTVAYSGAMELIEQIARSERAELIVLGSHGASGLERLTLGSVAESVLRHARCPVLIAGPHCKAEAHPFRSILFATDLHTTGLRGAQYAAALAERFHSRLTFLHVAQRPSKGEEIEPDILADRLRAELERLLPADVSHYCEVKVQIEYGKPEEAISRVARAECASLVVVGLHEHALLRDHSPFSTISRIIRDSTCAVLGVRGHLA